MKLLAYIVITFFLVACGSAPAVKSSAVCSIKKHVQDDIYQVLIDGKPVNNRWYLQQDANEMKIILAVRNKCKRK